MSANSGTGGLPAIAFEIPMLWRNGNAAVCKTAMSQFDPGQHLQKS